MTGALCGSVFATILAGIFRRRNNDRLEERSIKKRQIFDPNPRGQSPLSVYHLEALARDRLRTFIWKYISYESGKILKSARLNLSKTTSWKVCPRILVSRKKALSTSTTIFGKKLTAPLLVAPTAFHGLLHRGGEAATGHGVGAAGCGYCYNFSLANVGAKDMIQSFEKGRGSKDREGTRWAHVYIWKNREYVLWTLKEAERLGFDAVIVTCDHPHDRVKEATMPIFEPHENDRIYFDDGGDDVTKDTADDMRLGETLVEVMRFANLEKYKREKKKKTHQVDSSSAGDTDHSLTFDDLAWVCRNTKLPVVAKGILSPKDAILAASAGCRGICVSNHGKRQMDADFVLSAMEALPGIVATLKDQNLLSSNGGEDGRMVVLVDTGFRTGMDVLLATALGAHAVLLGRPVLWGLAAGGKEGVRYVFDRIRDELRHEMASTGAGSIEKLRTEGRGKFLVRSSP